ncbi:hypothetical protein [Paracoccus indicus]|uniref:hypothetical protein n=1 Tax=Paracoccus indicus TaxID=2079229 RepID=UPI0013B41419|nr:hypothetical protein [Paracoccus indicus]
MSFSVVGQDVAGQIGCGFWSPVFMADHRGPGPELHAARVRKTIPKRRSRRGCPTGGQIVDNFCNAEKAPGKPTTGMDLFEIPARPSPMTRDKT